MKWLLTLAALVALPLSAADISGKWKGTADTPNGTLERTFDFKVDGEKLTGTTHSEFLGESKIADGKVSGNSVTFSIKANFNGNETTLRYEGKIDGDTILFKVQGLNDMTIEYKTKRVS